MKYSSGFTKLGTELEVVWSLGISFYEINNILGIGSQNTGENKVQTI